MALSDSLDWVFSWPHVATTARYTEYRSRFLDERCQRAGCPNQGEIQFTAVGNVGNSEEVETVRLLLCRACADEALRMAAAKMRQPD